MYVPKPDSEWYTTIRRWIAERGELLVSYTLAGACGSGGYDFCDSEQAIDKFVSALPSATRIYVYRKHSLSTRGVVDDEFKRQARAQIPEKGDFLLVSLSKPDYSYGYVGYLGDTLEELDEVLYDVSGEHVAFGPAPDAEKGSERIVAYKDGIAGAY